ncbi:dipeptide ABC transporter ATP-binding protein [Lutispora thermophila]|uniref:Peptide/nickel transport system ATP-binding protein n=1 Tax=Lutispora thermophila DSM 19022 TaxID=1122184 RepID=A0A1M6DRA3_9FIRM|nr:ABC transporter ATP-binding protein [Lutispora thermophila]SHI75757.1 peptide/nickel transport system ATP-binding protein [Lutispora thermophila DSM 19022]
MSAYFEIRNLKVDYRTYEKQQTVLDIKRIAIERGKTYGIVGESGSGKTVLALTIMGLLQCPPGIIQGGEIIFDGQDLLKKNGKEMAENYRGNRIAMIFQDPMSTLNPVFTVGYQMIQIIKQNQKLHKKDAYKKAVEMMQVVKLPDAEDIMQKYPHQLSGGQRQRIIIAMALACGAEFLIADEPTRNLDVTIQASILKLMKELQHKFGVTVLFIANNLSLVSAFCDEIGILHDGRIVEQGPVENVIRSPQNLYTKMLIDSITKGENARKKKQENDEVLLEVRSLKKYFPVRKKTSEKLFVKAVDDVNLIVNKGEVLGIVGESGCGKSTLVNTILNLHEPTSGQVLFEGKNIFELDRSQLRKTRKDIQIVFQDPYWSLNPRWLVKDIISEPIKVHEKLDGISILKRVEGLLELVGLPKNSAFKYPHEFSGGQRQRIAIARALAVNPKLVVLDEPTSSIDVISQSQILELLEGLREKLGLTNILISHDLSVVNYMADKIIVMYLGKVVEYGDSAEVFKNPLHPYTKALFNSIPSLEVNGIESLTTLEGNVPSAINPPSGCRFHTRCSMASERCSKEVPTMKVHSDNHSTACFLYE